MRGTLMMLGAWASLAVAGSVAHAQQATKVETRTPRARTGAMPAPVVQAGPNVATPPREQAEQQRRDHHRRPSYVLLGDGTVLADLGYGYEQAVRSCAGGGGGASASSGTVINGGGSAVQPVARDTGRVANGSWQPYAPPVYVAPVATTAVAAGVCWTTDVYGRIVIIRQ